MLDVIRKRRSVRDFLPRDVEEEKIMEVLRTAMFAPTAWNLRPFLSIPENYRVQCLMPLGYPAKPAEPHRDNEFDPEKIHYDRFGNKQKS